MATDVRGSDRGQIVERLKDCAELMDGAQDGFALKRVTSELATAYAKALRDAAALIGGMGWQPIETAPKDGTAFLGYGIHDHSPDDAQRGVLPGDHWWSIILWDKWRTPRWVFAKDGTHTWSEPTHWMPLPDPPQRQEP